MRRRLIAWRPSWAARSDPSDPRPTPGADVFTAHHLSLCGEAGMSGDEIERAVFDRLARTSSPAHHALLTLTVEVGRVATDTAQHRRILREAALPGCPRFAGPRSQSTARLVDAQDQLARTPPLVPPQGHPATAPTVCPHGSERKPAYASETASLTSRPSTSTRSGPSLVVALAG
jgi:hypothetical protein